MTTPRVPELTTLEVPGMSRASFILRGALAAGATYGIAAVAPYVENAFAATAQSDLAVLNFALTLEALESAFYASALKSGVPGNARKLVTEIASHEKEHFSTLSDTVQGLGGKPPPAPKPKPASGGAFLRTAVALEEVGVGAYNGAATKLKSPDLLLIAGSIVQVEARHAAGLRELAGQDPAPAPFDKSLTQAQATAAAKPFTA